MELAKWMEAWRHGGQNVPATVAEPPAPLAAVYTNAAATLRLILNTLPASGATGDVTLEAARLVHLCGEVESCGAALGVSHMEHAAGQMRFLWQSVHNKTLSLNPETLPAMRACVSYLLHRLTQRRPFPAEPTEILRWNTVYQRTMAGVAPSASRSGPVQDFQPVSPVNGSAVQRSGAPSAVYRWVRLRPPVSGLLPPLAGALDVGELERLLLLDEAS